MNQSLTIVLERNTVLSGEFVTEPYEVAWAREARWFVRVLERRGADPQLDVVTEISPDGLTWCPLDDEHHHLGAASLLSWPVREFGGWLRIRGRVRPGRADLSVADQPVADQPVADQPVADPPGTGTAGDASIPAGLKVMVYLALKS